MANVNFMYRSTKDKATLNLRLHYSYNGKGYRIGGKTQLLITKSYWENDHKRSGIQDAKLLKYQFEVNKHLSELSKYILDSFYKTNINLISKNWLKNVIDLYYNPKDKIKASNQLVEFIDFYLHRKENDLSRTRKQRINAVKNVLIRYQDHTNTIVMIPEVDDEFKKNFQNYTDSMNYDHSTLNGFFSVIKTICRYAEENGIPISIQLRNLKVKYEPIKMPYLDFDELQKIKDLDLSDNERLDNARDWLIISCYTGQRISDFMRFTPEFIHEKEGKKLLVFTQRKTGKPNTIPVLEEVEEVLNKRNGEFPRPLSDQRYNDYIKEVCQLAGIDELIKGKRKVLRDPNIRKPKRSDYRSEIGMYPKFELISSHVGRRSFATNFYGKVPTPYLINITGHGSEKMFLKYIHEKEDKKALESFKYFDNLK